MVAHALSCMHTASSCTAATGIGSDRTRYDYAVRPACDFCLYLPLPLASLQVHCFMLLLLPVFFYEFSYCRSYSASPSLALILLNLALTFAPNGCRGCIGVACVLQLCRFCDRATQFGQILMSDWNMKVLRIYAEIGSSQP
jgi:hypothetical protein